MWKLWKRRFVAIAKAEIVFNKDARLLIAANTNTNTKPVQMCRKACFNYSTGEKQMTYLLMLNRAHH